ncbi:MAG: hypothetical protein AB4426_00030 [Xenococcaceae cyanobacterium]
MLLKLLATLSIDSVIHFRLGRARRFGTFGFLTKFFDAVPLHLSTIYRRYPDY